VLHILPNPIIIEVDSPYEGTVYNYSNLQASINISVDNSSGAYNTVNCSWTLSMDDLQVDAGQGLQPITEKFNLTNGDHALRLHASVFAYVRGRIGVQEIENNAVVHFTVTVNSLPNVSVTIFQYNKTAYVGLQEVTQTETIVTIATDAPIIGVYYSLDGNIVVPVPANYSSNANGHLLYVFTLSDLTSGNHTLTAYASNSAGTSSTPQTFTVYPETTTNMPTTSQAPPANPPSTFTNTLTVSLAIIAAIIGATAILIAYVGRKRK
jgi:hypothetical protein